MEIFIERKNQNKKLKFSGRASTLLKMLKLKPSAVLVVKNGNLVAEDALLDNKDRVKILSVISGG